MRAIVTVYGKDGTKQRKPVGYSGTACNAATLPYEAREIGTQKAPTSDMYEDPTASVEQRERVGE